MDASLSGRASPIRLRNGTASALDARLTVHRILGTSAKTAKGFALCSNTLVYAAGAGVVRRELENRTSFDLYSYSPKQLVQDLTAGASSFEHPASAPFIVGRPAGEVNGNVDLSGIDLGASDGSHFATKPNLKTNAVSCVAVSETGIIAAGEEGYLPRVVLYSSRSMHPSRVVAVLQEHQFGVEQMAFNPNGTFLATLGPPTDGYLYVWSVKQPGASIPVSLFASNRCVSRVNGLHWISDTQLVSVGLRHIRIWSTDPGSRSPGGSPLVLEGRSVVLGEALDKTFQAVISYKSHSFLAASSDGDIFSVTGANNQLRLEVSLGHDLVSLSEAGETVVAAGKSKITFLQKKDLTRLRTAEVLNSGFKLHQHGSIYLQAGSVFVNLAEPESLTQHSFKSIAPAPDGRFITWHGNRTQTWLGAGGAGKETVAGVDISCMRILPDWTTVIGGTDGTLLIADESFEAHADVVSDVDATEGIIVSGARDRVLQIWRLGADRDGWSLQQTIHLTSPIERVKLVDASTIVAYSANKVLHFFAADGNGLFSPTKTVPLRKPLQGMTISKGRVLVSGGDRTVSEYSPDGQPVKSFAPHDLIGGLVTLTNLTALEIDGRTLLAASASDKSVLIYSYPDGSLVAGAFAASEAPTAICWLETSRKLVVAGDCAVIYDLDLRAVEPVSPKRVLRAASPQRSPSPTPRSRGGDASMLSLGPAIKLGASPSLAARQGSSTVTAPGSFRATASNTSPGPGARLSATARPLSPSRLSARATPVARPSLSQSPSPIQALESALRAFLNADVTVDSAAHLEPLLVDALNKVDRYALVRKFSGDILARFLENR